jgi:hypothetical protein
MNRKTKHILPINIHLPEKNGEHYIFSNFPTKSFGRSPENAVSSMLRSGETINSSNVRELSNLTGLKYNEENAIHENYYSYLITGNKNKNNILGFKNFPSQSTKILMSDIMNTNQNASCYSC